MKRIIIIFLTLAILQLSGCDQKQTKTVEQAFETAKPLNIILLIGDGMGVSQVSSAFYFNGDATNFERFKHIGLINTSSTSHKITDSAAGGTAFSCGERTYNGAIGVNTDTTEIENIVEILSRRGYKSGVVATSSITHATPASFYAHVKSRGMEETIAAQLTRSEIDIFMGGGRDFFENREDNLNYTDSLRQHGFKVFNSLDDLGSLNAEEKYAVLAAEGALPPAHQGRGDFLSRTTEKSINYLSENPEGFFLMVESSQIDWGGHANEGDYVIAEMLDFDQVIGKALDFAAENEETLVVVTSDHETGGYTLGAAQAEGMSADYNQLESLFATGGHSATLIPVFAYGPGAEEFSGIYKNSDIFHKIKKLLD